MIYSGCKRAKTYDLAFLSIYHSGTTLPYTGDRHGRGHALAHGRAQQGRTFGGLRRTPRVVLKQRSGPPEREPFSCFHSSKVFALKMDKRGRSMRSLLLLSWLWTWHVGANWVCEEV